jgi:hypothetical protein
VAARARPRASAIVVVGCFLGAFLEAVRALAHADTSTAFLTRSLRAALLPVARAASGVDGVDGRVLNLGLVASHMLRAQAAVLPPTVAAPRLRSSIAHSLTVLSVSVAIYASFVLLFAPSVRASAGQPDAEAMEATFLHHARKLDRTLPPPDALPTSAMPAHAHAVDAELRALERGACAARAARDAAARNGLLPTQRFRLQLSWVLRAVWPAGMLVNGRTHTTLMRELADAAFYGRPIALRAAPASAAAPVPLGELVGGLGLGDDDGSSATGSSRGSSASVASS